MSRKPIAPKMERKNYYIRDDQVKRIKKSKHQRKLGGASAWVREAIDEKLAREAT